jgi:hypothetical protein
MSVNFGGVASGTGENSADGDDGLGVLVAAVPGDGEVEGRLPASVADGACARATP